LAFHPDKPVVYASQRDQVSAFRYTDEGALTLINNAPVTGKGACHLDVHPSGKALATSNYGDGTISTFLLKDDGSITPGSILLKNPGKSIHPRQQGPHAHGIHFLGNTMFVPDLGLDKILAYTFDPARGNSPVRATPPATEVTPGDGPRHLAFHPDKKHLFAIHELSSHAEAFTINGARLSSTSRVSTLPEDFEGRNTTAEIEAHPNGRWVFASNRGHDSIALFAFDAESGELTRKAVVPCGAAHPRHFTLTPDGNWLLVAGRDSNNIRVMAFDPESGKLEQTSEALETPSPICLKFLP
ncbi:MAG: lactonase family protein, partial [Verrucomicrobiota bacterium]